VWDELNEPLGFASGAAAALPARRKRPTRGAAAGVAILAMAIVLVVLPQGDFPVGGEPFAVAKVEVLPAPPKLAPPETTASVVQTPATPTASPAQVETTDGVKITRGSAGGPPKPLIIDVAQALGAKPASTPDVRLPEKSKYGVLPRIAQ
jgi:uncharacterized protein